MSQKKAQNNVVRLLNAGSMGRKLLSTTAITVASVLAASSSAYAVGLDETPTGGTVVGGQSTITYGQGSLTVDQTTDRSVINWNSFNIGEAASATYNQPGVNSLSVNRVTGADPSKILGTLRSNGKIMIIDPNGVFFSKTAKVDVGGIIATTGELDGANQAELMAGNKFQISNIGANPDAKIENAGTITAAQGGLVAFVAPWVSNSGYINAKLGSVTLAAGAKMTVDLAGDNLISIAVGDKLQKALIENSGTIDAQGGRVVMSANAAKGIVDEVINMSGVIKANSFSQKGGKIILGGGTTGIVKVSGKIEANGKKGGGQIEIKGENIFVTESGELHADAVTCGNGGTINIVAQNGLIYGGLSTAKGGALWGNGGFVDTSGLEWVDIWGGVDASAANGLAGTWLIDPRNLEIIAGGGNNTIGTGTSGSPFSGNGAGGGIIGTTPSRLQASVLNAALDTGTDVYVTTVGSPNVGLQDGTITIKADISKTSTTNSTLYMTAAGSIVQDANKTISSTNSKLGVSLTAEKDITLNGTIKSNGGDVTLNARGTVPNAVIFPTGDVKLAGIINTTSDTGGGAVKITAAKDAIIGGSVTTGAGSFSAIGKAVKVSGAVSTAATTGTVELISTANNLSFTSTGTVTTQGGIVTLLSALGIDIAGKISTNGGNVIATATGTAVTATELSALTGGLISVTAIKNFLQGLGIDPETPLLQTGNIILTGAGNIDAKGGDISLSQTGLFSGAANALDTENAGKITMNQNSGIGLNGLSLLTGSINNAIAAMNNTGDGQNTLSVSKGIFLESVLADQKNLLLKGVQEGVAGGSEARLNSFTALFDAENISLADIQALFGVNETIIASVGGTGFNIRANNVTIDGFTTALAADGAVANGVTGATVQNSVFLAGGNGVTGKDFVDTIPNPDVTYATSGLTVANNGFYGLSGSGVNLSNVLGANVNHNTMLGIGTGITANGGSLSAASNLIAVAFGEGITVNGGSGHSLSENTIAGALGGNAISLNDADSSSISGNLVLTAAKDGVAVTGGANNTVSGNAIGVVLGHGISGLNSGNLTINGLNIVAGAQKDGIHVDGGNSLDVSGNLIVLSKENGIAIDGGAVPATDATVSGNIVLAATNGDGIRIANIDGLDLNGNIVALAGDNGIELNKVNGATVKLNAAGGSKNHALLLKDVTNSSVTLNAFGLTTSTTAEEGDGVHVDGGDTIEIGLNLIGETNDDGIEVTGGAKNVTVGLNAILNAGQDGIDVNNATNTDVALNVITNAGDNGIEVVNATNANILANGIIDAGNNGIFVDPSTGITALNVITGAANNGIQVVDSNGWTVAANAVLNSGNDGIHIDNSDNALVGLNYVEGSQNNNIHVEDSNGVIVAANIVKDSVNGNGIDLLRSTNTTVALNAVSGSGNNGIAGDTVEDTTITLNKVEGSANDGIHIDGAKNTLVALNDVSGSKDDGIDVANATDTAIALNNVGTSGDNGIDTFKTTNLLIAANAVTGSGNDGIHVDGTDDTIITLNDVSGSKDDGIDVADATETAIALNKVGSSGDNGIDTFGTKNLLIAANAVTTSGNDGIHVALAEDTLIALNDVSESKDDGIDVSAAKNTVISLNKVTKSGDNGIDTLATKNLLIAANAVSTSGNDGIHVALADDTLITLNDVSGSKDDGIDVGAANNTAIGLNKVGTSGDNGIDTLGTTNLLVAANAVSESGNDGIHIAGAVGTIVALNDVSQSKDDGIDVGAAAGTVIGLNKVSKSGDNGIDTVATADTVIAGNAVSESGNDGIHVNFALGTLIELNDVSGSGNNGIDVANAGLTEIALNNVSTSGHNGIDLRNAVATGIHLNRVDGAGNDGIRVKNAGATDISLNHVSDAQDDGIDVDNAFLTNIALNKVERAGDNGIELGNAAGTLVALNNISASGNDGIHVKNAAGTIIALNTVSTSNDDGIDVNNAFGTVIAANVVNASNGNGIEVTDSFATLIALNAVNGSGENGIYAENADATAIIGNAVTDSFLNGVAVNGSRDVTIAYNTVNGVTYNDGIVVYGGDNIAINNNDVSDVNSNGITADTVSDLSITGNKVNGGNNNGIEVISSDGALIAGNHVENFFNGVRVLYSDAVDVIDNCVKFVANDGIQAYFADSIHILGNMVSNYGDDGIQVAYSNGVVPEPELPTDEESGNEEPGTNYLRLAANDEARDGRIIIQGNTVTGNYAATAGEEGDNENQNRYYEGNYGPTTGIRLGDNERFYGEGEVKPQVTNGLYGDFSGVGNVLVNDNDIVNNNVGLDARAFNNGTIQISDNRFTQNDIGAWIGSGLIDLTGKGNTFTGGSVALRFEPSTAYYPYYDYPVASIAEGPQQEGPGYTNAFLQLVDDSLGAQVFEQQTNYYVDLQNGAFFDPGSPTIIDGTQATYDGVSGGHMTRAQYLAIEAMLNDYDDNNSLGQIFAGFFDFDDNQILQKVKGNGYRPGKAGITVLALPTIPTGPTSHFFSIQDLADIAPAAGGDDQGAPDAAALASIEPAAGGNSSACWGAVGAGTNVNINLNDDATSILADNASCQQ